MKTALSLYGVGPNHEEFAKHCLRYGNIIKDVRGETNGTHWRKYVVSIDGWKAHICKENGVTVAACLS